MWAYQPVDASLPSWAQPPSPSDLDDLSDVLHYNALTDVPDFSNLGTEIGLEFDGGNLPFSNSTFPTDTLFDFDAFDTDQTGGLPHEASEPISSMQPSYGAPSTGSDRRGFAASG